MELRRYLGRLSGFSATLIIGCVAVLNIAPEQFVHLLYGDQYEGVGELVRLLCAPAAVYGIGAVLVIWAAALERTRLIFRSEEHTSELQSLMRISYAVFCLKKKNNNNKLQSQRHMKHHNKKKRMHRERSKTQYINRMYQSTHR